MLKIPYRTKFRRTKFSTDKIFRRTKLSTPSQNFDSFVRFLPYFCIDILDKIFDGQNVSTDKTFDTKLNFRHFCPTNFCSIRYLFHFRSVKPIILTSFAEKMAQNEKMWNSQISLKLYLLSQLMFKLAEIWIR